ncbi:hypothetical protein RB195_005245 [Necator americanus]
MWYKYEHLRLVSIKCYDEFSLHRPRPPRFIRWKNHLVSLNELEDERRKRISPRNNCSKEIHLFWFLPKRFFRSSASFEHEYAFEAIPVAAPAPVVAAPAVAAAPVLPYEVHDHFHPSTEVHNHVSSFQRESGHFSDTGMVAPFKGRRRAAKKVARVHKKAHKRN